MLNLCNLLQCVCRVMKRPAVDGINLEGQFMSSQFIATLSEVDPLDKVARREARVVDGAGSEVVYALPADGKVHTFTVPSNSGPTGSYTLQDFDAANNASGASQPFLFSIPDTAGPRTPTVQNVEYVGEVADGTESTISSGSRSRGPALQATVDKAMRPKTPAAFVIPARR